MWKSSALWEGNSAGSKGPPRPPPRGEPVGHGIANRSTDQVAHCAEYDTRIT
ncbi:hypothetical protein HALLA_05470 [Halostagnicola larsenii XH-48]|uniref:Uncharacterized protein n=1 Tax=Halostagnicola larsenii XH-48 TaxID=797299 RepID=W0JI63_9EURY|nr:hypothetical protein HALLA_05470 [Halostagnicola larsenii XH-48]